MQKITKQCLSTVHSQVSSKRNLKKYIPTVYFLYFGHSVHQDIRLEKNFQGCWNIANELLQDYC